MSEVITLAVIGALIGMLVPESSSGGVKKAVAALASLTVLLAVCEGMVAGVSEIREIPIRLRQTLFPDGEDAEEESPGQWVMERGRENMELGLHVLLCTRFSLSRSDLSVTAEVSRDSSGTPVVESVTLILRSPAVDGTVLVEYIEDLLGCPCHIAQKGGEKES